MPVSFEIDFRGTVKPRAYIRRLHMTKNNCPVIQKIEELVKKSNELKRELDLTPFEDKQKFMCLLKKLINVHKNLDQVTLNEINSHHH
jgi:hypothetical protein